MKDDNEMKISLNNIFWNLGCYTRLEVKLAEYSSGQKAPLELTDVDVLGIRITPELRAEYFLADCSSGRQRIKSPIQRAFWLRGVMEFFGASKGYISLKTTTPILETHRIVANKLGITILDSKNLESLEKRVLGTVPISLKLSGLESWNYYENNLGKIDAKLANLLSFRKHDFWMRPLHENIHAAIAICGRHQSLLNEADLFQKVLVADFMCLFSLSVLGMSAYALSTNPENPEVELKSYFYGGYTEAKRREKIVSNINEFCKAIQKQAKLFDESPFILDPEYLPNLFEISYRFLNKPFDASQIPRYLQMVLFEKILYKSENTAGVEYLEKGFSDTTKKLSKDMVTFFRTATEIPEKMLSDFY